VWIAERETRDGVMSSLKVPRFRERDLERWPNCPSIRCPPCADSLADSHRDSVVLPVESERSSHAAAAGVDHLGTDTCCGKRRGDRLAAGDGLLMTVHVDQRADRERGKDAAFEVGPNERVEEDCSLGHDVSDRPARRQIPRLVLKHGEAAGFEHHDGDVAVAFVRKDLEDGS
jgi:hypothetical protein